MEELISVIVPCFNSEKTLPRAIHSVIEQSYQNLEIIIINDGSEDDTLKIATEFSLHDSRIQVLNQSNQGVSVARNAGLAKATGTYIAFLDADDNYTSPYALADMLHELKAADADRCICNFTHPCFEQHLAKGVYDLTDPKQFMIYYQDFFASSMPWNKLTKRTCLVEPFVPNLKFGEDEIFNLANLKHLHKVVVTDKVYYNYHCAPYIPNNNASAITGALRDSSNRDTVWHLFMKNQDLRAEIIKQNFAAQADAMQYIRSFDFFFWVFFLMAKNRVPLALLTDSYYAICADPLFAKALQSKTKYGITFEKFTPHKIALFCKIAYYAFADIKTYHKKLSMYQVFLGIFCKIFVPEGLTPDAEQDILARVYLDLAYYSSAEAIYVNALFDNRLFGSIKLDACPHIDKCLMEWLHVSVILQNGEVGNGI